VQKGTLGRPDDGGVNGMGFEREGGGLVAENAIGLMNAEDRSRNWGKREDPSRAKAKGGVVGGRTTEDDRAKWARN